MTKSTQCTHDNILILLSILLCHNKDLCMCLSCLTFPMVISSSRSLANPNIVALPRDNLDNVTHHIDNPCHMVDHANNPNIVTQSDL